MKHIQFLDKQQVLAIYHAIMKQYGGAPGIRDMALLESALAQPQVTLFGEYAHKNVYEMGAAYCFHIIKNHPFCDGNKRTGLLISLTFFDVNGVRIQRSFDDLYHLAIAVADSSINKKDIATFFREIKK